MSKRTKELLRDNNAWEKENLSAENQQLMTNIVTYIRSAAISEYEQELVRRDVMAMLAAGEREGRSAEEVIGDDAQAFCDEVIAALPPRPAGVQRGGCDRRAALAVFSPHRRRCDQPGTDLCHRVHHLPWHFPPHL